MMIGTTQPQVLADFYEKVFQKKPDMKDGDWNGWMVGSCFFGVGKHSKMEGKSQDHGRMMFNLETPEVEKEFARIKEIGAEVIAEPYKMGDSPMMIATFADPDGNYFQLMTPWEDDKKEA